MTCLNFYVHMNGKSFLRWTDQSKVWTSSVKRFNIQIKCGITPDNTTHNARLYGVPAGLFKNQSSRYWWNDMHQILDVKWYNRLNHPVYWLLEVKKNHSEWAKLMFLTYQHAGLSLFLNRAALIFCILY